ncbi:MAG: S-methyl-5-thioribose-1-phosphate isomerase [Proteobacteria bacterium]|nr:S-methyl-5-thioribose-1-phosphate isomerase [Pseudomonadota bacterium]
MKTLLSTALKHIDGKLYILNQAHLPWQEEWIECHSPEQMADSISRLQVRGAPLIGISAALSLAKYVEQGANEKEIYRAAELLKSARPTAINLAYCIQKQIKAYEEQKDLQRIIKVAEDLFEEDQKLCKDIANHGFDLLESGDSVLTHCNTGGLVTTGIGTALGIIIHAHNHGKKLHVYVDETRPLLQGARLTTWELKKAGVPYTLICDNMAASLMRDKKIQKVIVGADRIAINGDFANKIGTYSVAVLAKHHNIPFYVAAPYTTVDPNCLQGSDIIIEQRNAEEVKGFVSDYQNLLWSCEDALVYNPAFDVTPKEFVTAFIIDKGILKPDDLRYQFL